MLAVDHFLIGMLSIHVAWAYCFLWGTALRRSSLASPGMRDDALLEITLATVTGIAVVGIGTFFLGLAGLIYPLTPIVALFGLFTVLAAGGDSPMKAPFWRKRLELLRTAASPGALIVWAFGIFRAVPAIAPDTGSDATVYHSVYAFEWAQAHALVVDPWLRLPWYPENWALIETWWFALHVDQYVEFLSPFAALLTILGVYGFICWAARRAGVRHDFVVPAIAMIAAGTFELSPAFLHWEDYPMIDVPAGLFFTAGCIAGIRAAVQRSRSDVLTLILCGAFLAAIKISYPALIPLFAGLVWVAMRAAGSKTKEIVAATTLLLALSSPWYIRDFILSGDPLTPLLNVEIHGVDPKFSRNDFQAQKSDLIPDDSPLTLFALPVEIFIDPNSQNYRELGAPLLLSLIWLPGAVVAWYLLRRSREEPVMMLLAACILYAYVDWVATAHTIRYAQLFAPLLACIVALVLILGLQRWAVSRYAGIALMALCVIPSPASATWYPLVWHEQYLNIGEYYHGRTDWLEQRSPAYQQVEYLSTAIHTAHREDLRVYTSLNGLLNLFFREHGMTSIGDVFGPERMSDLAHALLNNDLKNWIGRLHVGAILFDTNEYTIEPAFSLMPSELKTLGWKEVDFPTSAFKNYAVYLSPDLQQR